MDIVNKHPKAKREEISRRREIKHRKFRDLKSVKNRTVNAAQN
jgi:hypothetical protein